MNFVLNKLITYVKNEKKTKNYVAQVESEGLLVCPLIGVYLLCS